MPHTPKLTKHYLGVALAAASSLVLFGASAALAMYAQTPLQLHYHLSNLSVHRNIEVDFTQPVSTQLNYNLEPGVSGHWTTKQSVLGISAIIFHPSRPLLAGSSYQLVLGDIKKLGSSQPTIAARILTITTEKPAGIESLTPAAGATNVPVDSIVRVKLAAPNDGLRKLQLTSSAPGAMRALPSTDGQTYSWQFAAPLAEGTTYQLNLVDLNQTSPAKRQLATSSFTTVPEPQVTAATQTDHFYPGNTITVQFSQPMKPLASDFQFNLPGSGSWTSPTSYQFTPGTLTPGTSYSYTVTKGAASTAGGVTLADHSYTISPPGAAYVVSSGPGGSSVAVNATISFTFDQPVNQASAQAAFSLSPAANGSFSWSGNTLSYHANLGYQTGYTARVAAGVKGTYGLPSTRAFSDSFGTTYQTIKLNVPQYFQAYAQSCEEASLRMVLAFYNVYTDDYDILQRLGYNPTSRHTTTNSWDNPYQMFVGSVDGVQDSTGYGVFAPPIAAAAQSYGRSASVADSVTASYIAQQIYNGNPVIFWGYSVNPSIDSWNVPGGGTVTAYKGEHVRVVYGVAGSPGNVIGFYIHDPVYGNLYWTAGQLMANMNIFGATSNQTVTVH